MTNFASFLENNITSDGTIKSTVYFEQWLNNRLKLDSLNVITTSSDLSTDWIWIHRNVFDFRSYHDRQTIFFVCDNFINKWLKNEDANDKSQGKFANFMHESPIMSLITNQIEYTYNKITMMSEKEILLTM